VGYERVAFLDFTDSGGMDWVVASHNPNQTVGLAYEPPESLMVGQGFPVRIASQAHSISQGKDVDGDGYDDFIFSNTNAQEVYLFRGGRSAERR